MAADFIVIDKTKGQGNSAVVLSSLLQQATNLATNLNNNASHEVAASDFTVLEARFGLQTGAGANFATLISSLVTALATAPIPEYIARISNQ